jgi:hypothetical protein
MFLLFFIKNFFPFKAKKCFNNLYWKSLKLTKNKYFELEIVKDISYLFKMELDFRLTGKDHAGVVVSLGAIGYELTISVIDCRHWDYENNKWQTYSTDSRK